VSARGYRLVLRLRPSAGPPPILQELVLNAPAKGGAYQGELTAPPAEKLAAANNPLASLNLAALDVLAYDKDRVVARTTLDVQVFDDPPELQDPQPDGARLGGIARASGGKVLRSAEELAQLRGAYTSTPGEVVVQRAPAWDHAAVWLLLLALLTADWLLRRSWGLA
jgi:hypothetical protein